MQRTKPLSIEEDLETSSGSGTSISSATCVRLYNGAGAATTIAISASVGASASYTFTLPSGAVEFIEKLPTDIIWAAAASIKASKVGLTN
jgi:hypothetical protein